MMRSVFIGLVLILFPFSPSHGEKFLPQERVLQNLREEAAQQRQILGKEREALAAQRRSLEEEIRELQAANRKKKADLETLMARTRQAETEREASRSTEMALLAMMSDASDRFETLLGSGITLPLKSLKAKGDTPEDRLRSFMKTLYFHLRASDTMAVESHSFMGRDGRMHEAHVLRIGALAAMGQDAEGRPLFLVSHGSGDMYQQARRLPSRSEGRAIERALAGEGGGMLPVDLSGGTVLDTESGGRGLRDRVREGGLLIWPILFLGVAGLMIFTVRAFDLFRLSFFKGDAVMVIRDRRYGREGGWGAKAVKSPGLSMLVMAADLRDEAAEVREQMLESAVAGWSDRMERGIASLGVMAALAPMLGLLGTVTGMMASFRVMSRMGAGDIRLMSGGISEALVTTQWGLAVAVPLLLAHHLLSRRAERLALDAEDRAAEALALLEKESDHPLGEKEQA
ncbi:outer membrane transport energization protein ExbB [Desulfobotulus alkaliphilus]|uniref:Outer membrane transport energization protein ExbB n=1 Tax=Desulfobotulus alkaliphilus TaxID=622671 RepID=A0A562RRF7_9BACT|nr:MotA/TolQ/ExbB proton channel family protein [Desulfobotulus alkaliphilus]TWI71687.1 outer membrane transport energization protein ExbB [Desulfobotulus alkaliphilus]